MKRKKVSTHHREKNLKIISYIILMLAFAFLINGIFLLYFNVIPGDELENSQNHGFSPWNNIMKSLDIDDKYWITTNWNLAFALFLLMIFLMLRIRIRVVNSDDKDKDKDKRNSSMDEDMNEGFEDNPTENNNNFRQPESNFANPEEPGDRIHFTCPYCNHGIVTSGFLRGKRINCSNHNCMKKVKVPYKDETNLFSPKNSFSCILIIVLITLAIMFLVFGSL
jgi:preprotein translocase subunit SecG